MAWRLTLEEEAARPKNRRQTIHPDDVPIERPSVASISDKSPVTGINTRVPDVTGMTLLDAALTYAADLGYVLPTNPAVDIKSPGSVVKGHWQDQSSRDPTQIRAWWSENPDYGIALHCGRSGLIAFDLDINDLDQITEDGRLDIADALRSCPTVHLTRNTGDRGHYLYLMPEGAMFGNSAGSFTRWGQVRGKNGVIILAPTPHPDAANGGHYHWKSQ